jgi:transposase-like protein
MNDRAKFQSATEWLLAQTPVIQKWKIEQEGEEDSGHPIYRCSGCGRSFAYDPASHQHGPFDLDWMEAK